MVPPAGTRAAWLAELQRRASRASTPKKRGSLIEEDTDVKTAPSPDSFERVADLSEGEGWYDEPISDRSRILLQHRKSLFEGRAHHFRNLILLDVSRTPLLGSAELSHMLEASPKLTRLNASRCGLASLPPRKHFQAHEALQELFVHHNHLESLEDVANACSLPNLAWLTIFGNYVADLPGAVATAVENCPDLLAIDGRFLSDLDRLSHEWQQSAGAVHLLNPRFASPQLNAQAPEGFAQKSFRLAEERDPCDGLSMREKESAIVLDLRQELGWLQDKSQRCSPACCIQVNWRGYFCRKFTREMKARLLRAVSELQRAARFFLWKRRTINYIKDYLQEVDELDLLLDAKEMLRRRALKLIEVSMRRWIKRRNLQMTERKAAERITKTGRGFVVRRRLFYQLAELNRYHGIFFPERHYWEFLVIYNVVLRRWGHPTVSLDHAFEDGNVTAVRFPEVDEAPARHTTMMSINSYQRNCVVRPMRCGRYPDHPWDGPFHRLVEKEPLEAIRQAHEKVKRRSHNVNNHCRHAFTSSLCPGQHPIRRGLVEGEAAGDLHDCIVLKELVEGPESNWPAEAQRKDSILYAFMHEARLLGSKRWFTSRQLQSAQVDKQRGLRSYAETSWLNQRLLFQRTPTPKVAVELLVALHKFARLAQKLPSVEAVPVLHEKGMMEACSAAVLQSSWRAHQARMELECSVLTAVVLRRAAICIQRCWRWNLLKRRLEILVGAQRAVNSVKSPVLFIEERLFSALSTVSSIERYPPLVAESGLAFGICDKDEALMLLESKAKRRQSTRTQVPLRLGLPKWLLQKVQLEDLRLARADESLRSVKGLQGLLFQGLGDDFFLRMREEHSSVMTTVNSPYLEHLARLSASGGLDQELQKDNVPKLSLQACAGSFRFAELRYPSLLQARQRALVLYLCTYNTQCHTGVCMLTRQQLHSRESALGILRLWDRYGLDWPAHSKVGFFVLRRFDAKAAEAAIAVNGPKHRSTVDVRGEWQSAEDEQKQQGARRSARANPGRDQYMQQVAMRQRREFEAIQEQLHGFEYEELLRILETGKDSQGNTINGTQTSEAWITGEQAELHAKEDEVQDRVKKFGKDKKAEKDNLKEVLEMGKEQQKEIAKEQRASVDKWKAEKRGGEWEARLMDFHAAVREEKVTAEAECLLAGRKTWSSPAPSAKSQQFVNPRRLPGPPLAGPKELSGMAVDERMRAAAEERLMKPVIKEATWDQRDAEREWRHSRIQQEKAAKSARREAQKMTATFVARRSILARDARYMDEERAHEEREAEVQDRLMHTKFQWAVRTRVMAIRHFETLTSRRRQVDQLRHELKQLDSLRRGQASEDLQKKRAAVIEQKVFDRLLKEARRQLEACARDAGLALPPVLSVDADCRDVFSAAAGSTGGAVTASTTATGFDSNMQAMLDFTDQIESTMSSMTMTMTSSDSREALTQSNSAERLQEASQTSPTIKLPKASPGRPSPRKVGQAATATNWHESPGRWRGLRSIEERAPGSAKEAGPPNPVAPPAWPQRPSLPAVPLSARSSPRKTPSVHAKPTTADSGAWTDRAPDPGFRARAEPWLKRFGISATARSSG
eukprot:TRINITY_DN62167_c0_g1_i1.p1 TRINITY_DN62167_c0_g1~~TRINITY_DN62167_c0_g1_i1.p1  ORF type:complete len:1584 (+),score=373.87 TRINITY_DN62167_c0_g1_i1:97-4848(+)